MDLATVARSASWRVHAARRALREARSPVALDRTDMSLVSSAGYRLAARLTRPQGTATLPGVVISPAIHQGRAELEQAISAVSTGEVARLGYAVLSFDPAGRGESWGEEDFGGAEHQDDLRVAIQYLLERPDVAGVGVLALSYGIVAAAGALARYPAELPVRWLVDWEGPSDRDIITTGGTRLIPAAGHSLEDDAYWHPREPVRSLPAVSCGYVRLQALPDHAQPGELRHAERLVRAAASGAAPWFQLNDHPRSVLPARPGWLPGGPWAANVAILRKLSSLR